MFRFSKCILLYSRTHSIFYIVNTYELKQSSIFPALSRLFNMSSELCWYDPQHHSLEDSHSLWLTDHQL